MNFSKALLCRWILRVAPFLVMGGRLGAEVAQLPGPGTIHVKGWPIPMLAGDAPPLILGDDPVIGRQICPPLSRISLKHQKAEDLLLRAMHETHDADGSKWSLELKSGLNWWGGGGATAHDLKIYLEENLAHVVSERSGGMWEVPSFRVQEEGTLGVTILWSKKPIFGPYVLSGAPFFRPARGQSDQEPHYECVGLYQPQIKSQDLILIPTKAYKTNHMMPEVWVHSMGVGSKDLGSRFLEFRLPHDLKAENLGNDPEPSCNQSIDLPTATMILWNTQSGVTKSPEFRRLLSQLTPRGALVRGGTGHLADLSGTMIPKQHPGFHSGLAARAFDMRGVEASLDGLGFKRSSIGGLRKGPDGQDLKMTLWAPEHSVGLVEKVVSDTFTVVGIGVRFTSHMDEGHPPDGILSAFSMDWPRVNLIGNFHSKAKKRAPFWPLENKELDFKLEQYALTLTNEFPDFSKLREIQDLLYDLEPASVIFQHRACVSSGSSLRPLGKGFSLQDPDWFRQLLF